MQIPQTVLVLVETRESAAGYRTCSTFFHTGPESMEESPVRSCVRGSNSRSVLVGGVAPQGTVVVSFTFFLEWYSIPESLFLLLLHPKKKKNTQLVQYRSGRGLYRYSEVGYDIPIYNTKALVALVVEFLCIMLLYTGIRKLRRRIGGIREIESFCYENKRQN